MQVKKDNLRINFKGTSISLYTLVLVEVILPNPALKTPMASDGMKVVSWSQMNLFLTTQMSKTEFEVSYETLEITSVIIYKQQFLQSDWLRTCQITQINDQCNFTSAKK